MQQIIEHFLEQLRGAWRFRWIALVVAAAICFTGWVVIFLMPDRYRGTARVYVDSRTALSAVVNGISMETGVEGQIERVRQQLLGAPALQRVADETDLFRGAVTARDKQQRIETLRKEITIKGTGGSGVYVIEYENRDREMSQRVVEKLLNAFVEGTMGGKRTGSQKTTVFLTDQIEDAAKRLSEAELRVAEFKKKYFDVMPGQQGDYYTRVKEESIEAEKVDGELRKANEELATLQSQLKEQPQYVSQATASSTGAGMASPIAIRIRDMETSLDALLLKYKEKHPQVIALREQIADLKQKQTDELAAAGRGDSAAAASAGLVSNPVYQQIKQDLYKKEVQISALRSELGSRRASGVKLRGQLDTSVNVEAQYAQLNRDYEVIKAKYLQLVGRKEATKLGEEAQETGAVDFQIIDPPAAGFEPVAPVRPLLIPIVFVVALLIGGAVAYVMHVLSPVFYSMRTLEAGTGLHVIGVVPCTWLDRHLMMFRRQVFQYSASVAILVLFTVAVAWQQARLTSLIRGLTL